MGKKIKIKVVARVEETIRKIDGKYVVYPKKGGDRLGTHDSKSGANKQLAAIEISKSQNEGAEEETQPEYQYTIPKQNPQRIDNSNGSKEFIEKYNSLTSPAQSSSHFQIGDALRSTGVEGTFDSDYRVWKFPLNCEVLTSIKVNDNHIYLSLIFVSPNCGKKGFASTVMGELIRLANVTETMIGLHSAYSQDDVTYGDKLFDWYKKFGFGYDEKWFNKEMYDLVYSPKKNPSRKQQTPPQSAIEISKSQNEGVEEDQLEEKCQKGYKTHHKRKTKVMFGKRYRNCVKNERQLSDAEKITMDDILSDNDIISFDFDNTLIKSYPDYADDGSVFYANGGSNASMRRLIIDLIDDPSKKVYVVTSRNQEIDEKVPETSIETVLNKLHLEPDGFFYTDGERKVTKLKELGVQVHFDDDKKEHAALQGSGIQSFYPDEFLEDTMNVSKAVAVTMDNKVLILKRTDTGEFDIPGGHGKDGETAEFTAFRETKEETGLELSNLHKISTKQVTFKGREETITYLYAKLNSTSDVLGSEIDLDTNENTEFYFVDPQSIDDYMGNATQNLKNVGNTIKSLTIDEQMEPFQRKMAAGYSAKKKKMIGQGGNKYKSAAYSQKPSYKRSKSAPPGFGAMGEGLVREEMKNMLSEIDFDLSKLKMKDQLCPSIWKNNELMADVRRKLLQIAEDFINDSPIEGRVEDITLTGSLAGYNYHDGSDIDLHLLVDFGEEDEMVQKLMNLMRISWNENHNIYIGGHEVEIYVQDANEKHYSAGVYSLSDGKWLVEPSKEAVELDFDAIVNKAQGLSDEIDAIEDDYLAKRYEKAQKSVERLREKMKNMRSDGLEDEGIYSIENMAFKLLRNSGQIGKLMNLGNDSYDSELSDSGKGKIRVNIVQNVDEKKKKRRKKRKKAKKRRYHGVYYPYGGLQDTFSGDSGDGGDGGGGGE